MTVSLGNGRTLKFKECESGIYFHDTEKNTNNVEDIFACKKHERLTVSTNGGLISFDKKSTLKLLPMKVHFDKDSMATILSFKEVADIPGVRITTDTEK